MHVSRGKITIEKQNVVLRVAKRIYFNTDYSKLPCGIFDARGRLSRIPCGIFTSEGCASKNDGRFLCRRIARQKITCSEKPVHEV